MCKIRNWEGNAQTSEEAFCAAGEDGVIALFDFTLGRWL